MCPDLVIATQHIASISNNVTTEIYDINLFENYKNRYNVMSVPCMIINDDKVYFGKKNISQVLNIIEELND
jgi:thioredoxin reductase (NADPH)